MPIHHNLFCWTTCAYCVSQLLTCEPVCNFDATHTHNNSCLSRPKFCSSCKMKTKHILCLLWTVPSDVMRLMIQSYADYMRPVSLRVSVGTWNVNGGKHFRSIAFKHEHITDWLLDLPKIIRSTAPGTQLLSVMQHFANLIFFLRFLLLFQVIHRKLSLILYKAAVKPVCINFWYYYLRNIIIFLAAFSGINLA